MDFKAIKKLIDLVESSGVSELSIDEDGTKIKIKKELGTQSINVPIQAAAPMPIAAPAAAPVAAAESKDDVASNPNLIEVKAQMVGTFYTAPSPDAADYVKVGDTIGEGQVLCIIEAMKLFNEIESEVSGTIEKICLKSGDSVEFGQTLFLVQKG